MLAFLGDYLFVMSKMIIFEGFSCRSDYSSGCSFAPDKLLGIDLKPACVLHDYLRLYGNMSTKKVDSIFYRHLLYLGAPKWLAFIYWLGVRIASPLTR